MGREVLATIERQIKPSEVMSWIEKLQFLFKGMDKSGDKHPLAIYVIATCEDQACVSTFIRSGLHRAQGI